MPNVEGVSCFIKSFSWDTKLPRPGKYPKDLKDLFKSQEVLSLDLGWFHPCESLFL